MYTLHDIFEGDYPVTQIFGANPSYYGQFYIYGVKQKGHEAVDFGLPVGIKVLSPFDGKILRAGYQADFPNYGLAVCIWDPIQKCAVWHCHLSEVNVKVGDLVKTGQVVGKSGMSGNTTGPHDHFILVETDANGNRLHQYDGYGGGINCLDPSIVKWVLGAPPVDPWVQKVDTLKIAVDRVKSEFDGALANQNVNKQQLYNDVIAKLQKIVTTGSL